MRRIVQLAEFRFQQMADAPMREPAGCGVGGGVVLHDPEEVRQKLALIGYPYPENIPNSGRHRDVRQGELAQGQGRCRKALRT